MTNPARELHEIFDKWRTVLSTKRTSVSTARGDSVLEETSISFRLLDLVNQQLDRWDSKNIDVSIHRKHAARWRDAIFAFPNGWKDAIDGGVIHPESSMDALWMLAQMIDMSADGFVPSLAEDQIRSLMAMINEALADDDTLDQSFRNYMERLLSAVSYAMQHRDADQLREDLQHLWFAIFAAEEVSEQDGTWRDVAKRFGWDTFTQTLSSIAGGVATKMLTGG